MEPQTVQPAPTEIQAAWNEHRARLADIERTTGQQLAAAEQNAASKVAERDAAEREVARLRAEEANLNAVAQELRAKHANERTRPTLHMRALIALCDAEGFGRPQDPQPPRPEDPLAPMVRPADALGVLPAPEPRPAETERRRR